MEKKQKNMAVDAIEAQMKDDEVIEAAVLHRASPQESAPGHVKVMVSMTVRQRDALKAYAAGKEKTVSRIVQDWVDRYCFRK